jgi:ABC-type uncharacterized transport system substrate-binding protein
MCAHGNRHCSHALEDNQFCRVVQRKKDEVKASEQTKKKSISFANIKDDDLSGIFAY